MYSLFKSFLVIMKSRSCNFITDQQHSIASALNSLKIDSEWNGHHFLDTFHIIKNIRKKTKNLEMFECLRSAVF